jgi:hypothetical protein
LAIGDQGFAQHVPSEILRLLERQKADERIRKEQQGLGRPIVAFKSRDQQFVAVGKTLHHSPAWKTFPDFLAEYIRRILDPAWGNAELAKPFADRHPIVQWYDAFCRYQQATIATPGVSAVAIVNGVVACYLGLAYSLYLLQHNVELQKRLVARLRIPDQFQGTYYELIVANILIRAGFELELEDEADGDSKHCEFSARSKRTGKKYWVEAKMRSVVGLLGKTQRDGTTDTNPLNRFIPQLNDALAKPAADERLIFIDLNTDPTPEADGKPPWIEKLGRRLEQYERKELPEGTTAYVFATNFSFHRTLNGPVSHVGVPYGLGIPDFNRPALRRLSDGYRLKQKHIDAHYIGEAFLTYTRFPSTFDGALPSEAIQNSSRVILGNTHCFGDPASGGVIGTVTAASVDEQNSQVTFAVLDQHGRSSICIAPMTSQELADYRAHKDSYFGKIVPAGGRIDDPFELFEWFVGNYKGLTRDQLLQNFARSPNIESLQALSDEDLLYEYCERLVAAVVGRSGRPAHDRK